MKLVHRHRCIVTPSMLTLTLRGLDTTSQFPYWNRNDRVRANVAALGSVLKHGVTKADGDYLHLFHVWGTGYYHFITEIVPKFLTFESEIRKTRFLVPPVIPGYVREFLDLFEFGRGDTISRCVYFPELDIITNPVPGQHEPDALALLKARLFERLGVRQGRGRKIYVSRGKAARRHVVNDEEVSAEMEARGFETYYFEDHSLADQIRVMADCDVLVGIHGSALANAMFMRRGGKVIEFFPDGGHGANGCFENLSQAVGLKHQFVFCERADQGPYDFHNNDIIVRQIPTV